MPAHLLLKSEGVFGSWTGGTANLKPGPWIWNKRLEHIWLQVQDFREYAPGMRSGPNLEYHALWCPPPGATYFFPDPPPEPNFLETGLFTGMPPSNNNGYVPSFTNIFDPCYRKSTHYVAGHLIIDSHSGGETCLSTGMAPSNSNGYAPSVSPFVSSNWHMSSCDPPVTAHFFPDPPLDCHSEAIRLSTDIPPTSYFPDPWLDHHSETSFSTDMPPPISKNNCYVPSLNVHAMTFQSKFARY